MAEDPADRLRHHIGSQHDQQAGLGQGRHRLHLAMPVVVLLIGGLAGGADGEIGQDGRARIQQPVARLRHQRQRPGEQPCGQFAERQQGARGDGGEGGLLLESVGVGHGVRPDGSLGRGEGLPSAGNG